MTDEHVDAASFESFAHAEFQNILALAIAALGSRDDALDVAQETMTRAFDRWAEVAAMDRPGAWARRVALNLVTDHLRRRTRRHRLAVRLQAQPPPADAGADTETWDRAFWAEVVALPERQRDVVLLHYVEDLAVADIASVLEVPAGTVKSDLSRARASLRATIEGETQ